MQRIRDRATQYLFDEWEFLGEKRKKMLAKGWPGIVRGELLERLPIERVRLCFDAKQGRPTKELYTMVGVVVLQQMLDLTDREVVAALAFDARWHYALDIRWESDADKYVCERTVRGYRKRMVELGLDRVIFERLTDRLLAVFEVETGKQRLDSTLIRSNMRHLHRGEIFVGVMRRFLKALRRSQKEEFEKVGKELVERYVKEEAGGCFSCVKPSEVQRTVERMGEDLLWLVERFRGNGVVEKMASYGMLKRVLSEQCEVVGGEGEEKRVRIREPKEVRSDSLQNPSDPDATYDKHKGQGYQVQIMETYGDEEEGSLDLITYVEVERACESDAGALLPAIEETQERGWGPEEVLADGGYGSDENVQKALEKNVEVISPANKGMPLPRGRIGLEEFEFEEETGEVSCCPAGERPIRTGCRPSGVYTASFDRETCLGCELRGRCPVRIGPQSARLKPYTGKKFRLARRRAKEKGPAFREKYRWRAGIEGTMSRYKSQMGAKRLRVRGMGAVCFAVRLKALGMNILRCGQAVSEGLQWRGKPFWSVFGRESSRFCVRTWLSRLVAQIKGKNCFFQPQPV